MRAHAKLMSILTVLLLMQAIGCDDEPPDFGPRSVGDVTGRWAWVLTHNNWTGKDFTPADAGYTETLVLEPDGVFTYLRDRDLVRVGEYTVDWGADPVVLDIAGGSYVLEGDELVFGSEVIDGPIVVYRWYRPL